MNTIVICTNNLVPPLLFRKVLMNAFTQADMRICTNVVVVSHYPVFEKFERIGDLIEDNFKHESHPKYAEIMNKEAIFDPKPFVSSYRNIVVGECEYSQDTIYKQLLIGAQFASNNTIIMEHDVLYPVDYVRKVSGILNSGIDLCYWANGKFFSNCGFFEIPDIMTLSRFAIKTDLFIEIYRNKVRHNLKFVEPILSGLNVFGDVSKEKITDNFAMVYGTDTIDVRHGLNVTGNFIVEDYSDFHEYWGSEDEIKPLISGTYKEFVEKHPSCNFGIWS